MTDIEKLDLKSMNVVEERWEQLKAILPEAFTEGGKIDFERLKLALGEMVDPGKERYGMNWPGKADCFKIIQQPSIATLTPAREESVDFDTTENLFIEGDNLEVLKLLQKSYFGKIKMIYIDPPYNTGNDFIYPDDYSESLDTYLRYTGQIDDQGRKYSTNTEADGRFHSKWMNMMYPRLFLARNLLREDGVIFISIDDVELDNLRKICNEIFGEVNFVAQTVRVSSPTQNVTNFVSVMHDYLLIYCKNKVANSGDWKVKKNNYEEFEKRANSLIKSGLGQDEIEKELRELVKYPRFYDFDHYYYCDENGVYQTVSMGGVEKGNTSTKIIHPKTGKPCKIPQGGWRYKDSELLRLEREKLLHFGEDEETIPRRKLYLKDYLEQNPRGISFFDSQQDVRFLKEKAIPFDFPKPVAFLKQQIEMVTAKNEIILDFFAGSASTAHAAFDLNKDNGGNRKFIMVQLPEPTDENSEAHKAGYKTIADIGKERIRRVIKKIKDEREEKKDLLSTDKPELDLGFKVFKLRPSNFKLWDGDATKDKASIEKQIEMFVDHINPKSSQEDILYELLLKSGFALTTKIEKTMLADKAVYSIDKGSMFICLEKELTPEVIKAMAEKNPVRVVCLDEGFKGNDQLKTNAVQIMKSRDITFRTV